MLLATRLLVSAYLWAGVGAISGFAFEHGYVFGMAAGLVIADLDHRDSLLHHSFPRTMFKFKIDFIPGINSGVFAGTSL